MRLSPLCRHGSFRVLGLKMLLCQGLCGALGLMTPKEKSCIVWSLSITYSADSNYCITRCRTLHTGHWNLRAAPRNSSCDPAGSFSFACRSCCCFFLAPFPEGISVADHRIKCRDTDDETRRHIHLMEKLSIRFKQSKTKQNKISDKHKGYPCCCVSDCLWENRRLPVFFKKKN